MKPPSDLSPERLAHEIAHDDAIAPRAEIVWNWATPTGRHRATRRAALFADVLDARPGLLGLELGCGSGVFLERAVTTRAAIVALDLSASFLRRARARPGVEERARVVCGDAQRLPFPNDTFDVVYGSSVLHHLDLSVALGEVYRVLRRGGRLAFAEPNLLNPHILAVFWLMPRRWSGASPDEAAFTRFYCRRALCAAGFVEVKSRPYDFMYPLVPQALIPAVARFGALLERVPLLREVAGSQFVTAQKP
jgi:SAM-dependent methyltransferase